MSVAPAPGILAAGDYVLPAWYQAVLATNVQSRFGLIHLALSDWAVYDKELRWFTEFVGVVGDVPPGVNVYTFVAPITGLTGATNTAVPIVGAAVAGSTSPTVALPAANSVGAALLSPDFTLPASGIYSLVAHFSGAFAVNSVLTIPWRIGTVSR